jgi:hypothetical protein
MEPDLLHHIIGLLAAAIVALLSGPGLVYVWKTSTRSRGGYIQLGGDSDYEDRDGIATEDSIRAFSDTRARVAVWLGTVTGLGASIAARILVLKDAGHGDVLSEVSAWTEPACWVGLAYSPWTMDGQLILSIGFIVLAVRSPPFQTPAPSQVPPHRLWFVVGFGGCCLCRSSPRL